MNMLAKALFRRLVRTGVKRGLIDGNRLWLYVGGLSWVARRLLKPKPPIVRRETLEPGETLVITNVARSHRLKDDQKKAHQTE